MMRMDILQQVGQNAWQVVCHAWKRGRKAYEKYPLLRFFTVFASVCLLYRIMYKYYGGYFLIVDDTNIMKIVSGYKNGTPTSYQIFICTLAGWIYKVLYTLMPSFSWYSYFFILSTILCVTVIVHVILEELRMAPRRMQAIGIVMIICYFAAVLVYPFYFLSWTFTASLCGVAAIMLVLQCDRYDKGFFVKYAFCMGMLFLSSLIRTSSYKSMLPFFLVTFVYEVLLCWKKWGLNTKKIIIFTTVITLAVIWGSNKLDQCYKNNVVESTSYAEFSKYRSRFSDYEVLPYEGNEEFYESLGWDKELYTVSRQWMYLDPRFNTENLKKITEASQQEVKDAGLKEQLKNAWICFQLESEIPAYRSVMKGTTMAILCVAVAGMTGCLWCLIRRRKNFLQALLFTGVNWLGVAEICYLCLKGRFIYRSFLCAVLPTLCIDGFLLVRALVYVSKSHKKFIGKISLKKMAFCMACGFTVASCCYMINIMMLTFSPHQKWVYDIHNVLSWDTERYCMANQDKFFVHGYAYNDTSLLPHMEMRGCQRNYMHWGDCDVYSKTFYDTINGYGFSEFYTDKLLEDNVYFMFPSSIDMEESDFMAYMRKTYGEDVECKQVDIIDSTVGVYKFSKPDSETLPETQE